MHISENSSTPKRFRGLLDEIDFNQIDFDPNIIKQKLSPTLWKDGELNQEVRVQLLKAAKVYYEYLDISAKLKDITITGSMANYNYHDLSDIDVHLILDYSDIDDNEDLVREFFAAKKALWGIKHNIEVKGHELEFYAQDSKEPHHSTGVFSLVKNKWNIKPEKQSSLKVDGNLILKKSADFMTRIDTIVSMNSSEAKLKAIESMKDKIKSLRQTGLDSDAEEFSTGNLVFKVLRNNGYLEKLSDSKLDVIDQELSLDEKDVSSKVEESGLSGLDPIVSNAATKNVHIRLGEIPVLSLEEEKDNANTLMIQDDIEGLTQQKIDIIKDFICFTRSKLKLNSPVKVGLRKGLDEYIKTTASYLPFENENYVRCEGRALVDILRSIGHELTHNRQRELGIFNPGDKVQNIGGEIEDQANAIAGILIKDFADNYGYGHIHQLY